MLDRESLNATNDKKKSFFQSLLAKFCLKTSHVRHLRSSAKLFPQECSKHINFIQAISYQFIWILSAFQASIKNLTRLGGNYHH